MMNILTFWKKSERMYVIIGEQIMTIPPDVPPEFAAVIQKSIDESKAYQPPAYDTDPRRYNLPVFNECITDEEFEADYRHKIRAFKYKDDARRFAATCNMVSLQCPVYVKKGAEWVYSSNETLKMAEELS